MNGLFISTVSLIWILVLGTTAAYSNDRTPVAVASSSATTTFNNQLAIFATDGITTNPSRWVSEDVNSQHRLTLELGQITTVEFIKISMGWSNSARRMDVPYFQFSFRVSN